MKDAEPLTFEEFSHRDPVPTYNNLFLYFTTTGIGPECYRSREHFQRFQAENTELESRVTEAVMDATVRKRTYTSEALRPCDQLLYEAYLKMRKFVDSDKKLFR